jgi:transposase InsO family protein
VDDFSRSIIACRLLMTMATTDVKELPDLAVDKSGIHEIAVRHRPQFLSDNRPAYVLGDLKEYLAAKGMTQTHGAPSHDSRQDRAGSSINEERDQSAEVLPTVGAGAGNRTVRELQQQPAVSRIVEQHHAGGRVLRLASGNYLTESTDQT